MPSKAQQTGEPIRLVMIEGMSGPFANVGEAWKRNLQFAVDAVNREGGVRLRGADGREQRRMLALEVLDGKSQVEDSLVALRTAIDRGATFIAQGASSAVAGAFIEAIEKHNARNPTRRVLFLNYAAVSPELTNEKCSFWHFRFDAHAGMRLQALTDVLKDDAKVARVWLINQDYSFGRDVARIARQQITEKRPDVQIVGEDWHAIGRIKDFSPYIQKMIAARVDTVVTGNWGADLTLLVKAAREAGLNAKFYTFYGNSLGAPMALGEAGVGRVRAVGEWHPNVGTRESDAYVTAFRTRYPDPREDYQQLRPRIVVEMLAAAIQKAGSADALSVARALEGAHWKSGFHEATMRAADHQIQQPLYVSVMQRKGDDGVKFDSEGSGFGFRTERYLEAGKLTLPSQCVMKRPQ